MTRETTAFYEKHSPCKSNQIQKYVHVLALTDWIQFSVATLVGTLFPRFVNISPSSAMLIRPLPFLSKTWKKLHGFENIWWGSSKARHLKGIPEIFDLIWRQFLGHLVRIQPFQLSLSFSDFYTLSHCLKCQTIRSDWFIAKHEW